MQADIELSLEETIGAVLYKLTSLYGNTQTQSEYEELVLADRYETAMTERSLEDSGYSVLQAYNTYCDTATLGDTRNDEQAIVDYNNALTYEKFVDEQTEDSCVSRHNKYLADIDDSGVHDLDEMIEMIFDFQTVDGALDVIAAGS